MLAPPVMKKDRHPKDDGLFTQTVFSWLQQEQHVRLR